MLRSLSQSLFRQSSRCLATEVCEAKELVQAFSWRITSRLATTRASYSAAAAGDETVTITFKDDKDGSVTTVQAPVGESILEVAHENEVELEGACEGSLACSTCHVIVEDQEYYDKIPEPDDDENDMLDLAFGLTDTSRLGCQIKCVKELDGMSVRIPSATRNMAVDGYRPKPH